MRGLLWNIFHSRLCAVCNPNCNCKQCQRHHRASVPPSSFHSPARGPEDPFALNVSLCAIRHVRHHDTECRMVNNDFRVPAACALCLRFAYSSCQMPSWVHAYLGSQLPTPATTSSAASPAPALTPTTAATSIPTSKASPSAASATIRPLLLWPRTVVH